jgi:hypothetical protein
MLNSLMTPRGVRRRQRTDVVSVAVPLRGPPGMSEIFGNAERGVKASRLPPVNPYGLFQGGDGGASGLPAGSIAVLRQLEQAPSTARRASLAPLDEARGVATARSAASTSARKAADRSKAIIGAAPPYLRALARDVAARATGADCTIGSIAFGQIFAELGASEHDCTAAFKLVRDLKGRVTLGAIIEVFEELLTNENISAHVSSKCFAVFAANGEMVIDKVRLDGLRRSITMPKGVTFEMVMALDRAVRTRPREESDARMFLSEGEFCSLLTDPGDPVAPQLVEAFAPTMLHVLVTTFRMSV